MLATICRAQKMCYLNPRVLDAEIKFLLLLKYQKSTSFLRPKSGRVFGIVTFYQQKLAKNSILEWEKPNFSNKMKTSEQTSLLLFESQKMH